MSRDKIPENLSNRIAMQNFIIIGIVILSVILTCVAAYATYMGDVISGITLIVWSLAFALMMAAWTNTDAKLNNVYKPFEYSYLVFMFWPLVLPYHLFRTRGVEGGLMYVGILGLYLLPILADLVVWVYFVQ